MEVIQNSPPRVVRITDDDRERYAIGDGPFRVEHECLACGGVKLVLDAKDVATLRYVVNRCGKCERAYQLAMRPEDCPACNQEFGPSHMGSKSCRSGSLASGGSRSHCTCDTCF